MLTTNTPRSVIPSSSFSSLPDDGGNVLRYGKYIRMLSMRRRIHRILEHAEKEQQQKRRKDEKRKKDFYRQYTECI
jgi:hypothetical protein